MALLDFFRRSKERKYSTLDFFRDVYGGRGSKAGQLVNVKTALEVAVVFACVRVLAEGISQVPLKLFKESADGKTRIPATDHPLYDVLFRKPNPWQTSFAYRETLMMHAVLCGNAYSFKNVIRGNVVELIPFEPGTVTVRRNDDYSLAYDVMGVDGRKQTFPETAIWHVRGPSWNSWMGLEAVSWARNAIGLAMGIEEQQSGFYERGAQPSGILSVEGNLTGEQYAKLRTWVNENHAGSQHAFRPMILDRASKFLTTSMTSVDAQTLEQRIHQAEEICRAFRVMPIMIGISDKAATYASAEQMFLAHVVHSLSPWFERLEQSINVGLLSDKDAKSGIYAKFIEEGLLRGALLDTATYLVALTGAGIMTRNEARGMLELNALSGLDEPLTPVAPADPSKTPTKDPKTGAKP